MDQQAIARAHRLGQKKTVTVVRMLLKGTIEEEIYKSYTTSETRTISNNNSSTSPSTSGSTPAPTPATDPHTPSVKTEKTNAPSPTPASRGLRNEDSTPCPSALSTNSSVLGKRKAPEYLLPDENVTSPGAPLLERHRARKAAKANRKNSNSCPKSSPAPPKEEVIDLEAPNKDKVEVINLED